MGVWRYRQADPTLPWMGAGIVPRRLRAEDVRAVLDASDAAPLAMMLAYARSYAGASGGVALGASAAVGLALSGRRTDAARAAAAAGFVALTVIETRRRARQWEAVIETRLAFLAEEGT